MMLVFTIEHKITTLAHTLVKHGESYQPKFSLDEVEYSHWDFNFADGWRTNAWLASAKIEAEDHQQAYGIFNQKLIRAIPRMVLISQVYTEFINEPFMIHEKESEIACFRYIKDSRPVGLPFQEDEVEAVKMLLSDQSVRKEFYYYWNDAVNATGYGAKLLLMLSAIEALAKVKRRKNDWKLIREILGDDLFTALFGEKGDSDKCLRNRLVHGEYFDVEDGQINYVEEIHRKIVGYFNSKIFNKNIIGQKVVNPHRHPFGNKRGTTIAVRTKVTNSRFDLKTLMSDFNGAHFEGDRYEIDHGPVPWG